MNIQDISALIQNYPDFPSKGIQFKDISPVLQQPDAFRFVIKEFTRQLQKIEFDCFIGIDARGFIFASALAYHMEKGLIMSRKEEKLPGELETEKYHYEYSTATLSMQKQRIEAGKKYVIVDDVLATGQTAAAVAKLVQKMGGKCAAVAVFLELRALYGRTTLQDTLALQPGIPFISLIQL